MSTSVYIPSSRAFRAGSRLIGRCEKPCLFINMPDKPIRPPMLALHIKAAAECPAGSQNPENLPISGFLVRKSMKAVQRQNDVESIVCIGKRPHIALPEGYIFQVQTVSLFLCLPHHIRRVIEAGDVRLLHSPVNRHGQNTGSHRHFQQLAGEMLRNPGHCLFQIGVVFRLVHCPHQAAHRFPAQSRAGDHAVIKTVSARHSVRTANGFFSFHGSSLRVSIITRPFPSLISSKYPRFSRSPPLPP